MLCGAKRMGSFVMVAVAFSPVQDKRSTFYVWMAAVCALVAFGGFSTTYWLQLPASTFIGPPLLHIHAALFSAWTLLLLSQTSLAASGRLSHHRAWGFAGISLATAMVIIGMATAIYSLRTGLAAGYGDRARAFFIVPVSAVLLFAGFFAAAVANINRPEAHKRLMLLATISLLAAAAARLFFAAANGVGPGMRPGLIPPTPVYFANAPSLLLELLIVAGIIYDWRTRGRPHPVWYIGAAVITAVVLLRVPISATPQWMAIADAMTHIGG
jgi:hypothetical protein